MQPTKLSRADASVLAQVFDPESAPTTVEVLIDPDLPADRMIDDASLLASLKAREKKAIKLIEAYETSSAKSQERKHGVYRQAVALLDLLIAEHLKYASARNNRAQLQRWRSGDRNTLVRRRLGPVDTTIPVASRVLEDLNEAIRLASPERATDAVSPSQGRLLGQAYTQLAAQYFAAAKDLEEHPDAEVVCSEVQDWSKEAFEEEASRLFYLGGLYGNEVAKALAVHTNPHAKLCGSIVREAMRKEIAQA